MIGADQRRFDGLWSEGRLASTNHQVPHCDLGFATYPITLNQRYKEKKNINTPVLSGPPSSLDRPLRSDKSQGVERREKICCLEVYEMNDLRRATRGLTKNSPAAVC